MLIRAPGFLTPPAAGSSFPQVLDFVYHVGATELTDHDMPITAGSPQPDAISYTTDDVGIVFATNDDGEVSALDDTGWTSIGADTWNSGHCHTWWKKLTSGGLPDPFGFTFSSGGNQINRGVFALLIIRGAHGTTPIGGNPWTSSGVGVTTVQACPDLTTGGSNRLIIRYYAQRVGNRTADTGYGTGVTGLFLRGTGGSLAGHSTLGVAWETQASAGAVGTHAFVPSGGTADENGAGTIEVIPA